MAVVLGLTELIVHLDKSNFDYSHNSSSFVLLKNSLFFFFVEKFLRNSLEPSKHMHFTQTFIVISIMKGSIVQSVFGTSTPNNYYPNFPTC